MLQGPLAPTSDLRPRQLGVLVTEAPFSPSAAASTTCNGWRGAGWGVARGIKRRNRNQRTTCPCERRDAVIASTNQQLVQHDVLRDNVLGQTVFNGDAMVLVMVSA